VSTAWTLASVAIVSIISLLGALGLSFGLLRNHRVMMFLIAAAAGTLIGDAWLHLLPEAAHDGFTPRLGWMVIAGFLAFFVLEVVLRRGHSHAELLDDATHAHQHMAAPAHAKKGLDGHTHSIQPFGWLNLVGDALHNLLDGVIIAAAYLIDTAAGVATTIAVAAHEIPQELGDFAVLVRSGMPVRTALMLNFGSALFAFLGAGIVLVAGLGAETLEAVAVPLIGGAFLYIAAADLIPELHHHTRGYDMWVIVAGLVAGLLLMGALLNLEALLPGIHAE